MGIVLFLLGACIILWIASGTYVFVAGCVRTKEISWLDADALQNTPYEKYSKNIAAAKSWLDAHQAQSVSITSHDGLSLKGVWVPSDNPKGTVLLAHGYRSSVLVDFGLVFDFYHQQGMNLLLPDQRSHGRSQGHFITFGVLESKDMAEWIRFHNQNFGKYPVLLSGMSMGASTVLYLADADLPENVRGIIADCGFTSPKDIISKVFRTVTHLPVIPTIWFADFLARIFAGFSFSDKDTRTTLRNSRLPVLMVHGKEDTFVPCKMSEEGFAACTSIKNLLLVDQANHGVSFLHARERYTELVLEFLDKYILSYHSDLDSTRE